MNVNGPVPPILVPPTITGARAPRAPGVGPSETQPSEPKTQPNEPRAQASGPATGSLWDVLTPEERDFFTQQAALGPLTYRPGGAASELPPAPTGRRIDVRG